MGSGKDDKGITGLDLRAKLFKGSVERRSRCGLVDRICDTGIFVQVPCCLPDGLAEGLRILARKPKTTEDIALVVVDADGKDVQLRLRLTSRGRVLNRCAGGQRRQQIAGV